MHYENPEESFEGIRKLWGNMLSFWFFADFEWVFCNFHKYLAWFLLIYPLCLETISEKNCFLVFFSLVNSDFERNCLDYWKKTLLIGNTFFHVSRGLSERKNFHQYLFFKMFFGLWEKSFQNFDVLLIGRAFKVAFFFYQRPFVTRNNFFQVNEITIKIFWPPTVSFLDFWWKR